MHPIYTQLNIYAPTYRLLLLLLCHSEDRHRMQTHTYTHFHSMYGLTGFCSDTHAYIYIYTFIVCMYGLTGFCSGSLRTRRLLCHSGGISNLPPFLMAVFTYSFGVRW